MEGGSKQEIQQPAIYYQNQQLGISKRNLSAQN